MKSLKMWKISNKKILTDIKGYINKDQKRNNFLKERTKRALKANHNDA